jgi:hypothetical protein
MSGNSFRACLNLQDLSNPKFFVDLIFPKFNSPISIEQPFPVMMDQLGGELVPIAQLMVEEGWKVTFECTHLLGVFKVKWPDFSRIVILDIAPLKITVKGDNTFVYEIPELVQ